MSIDALEDRDAKIVALKAAGRTVAEIAEEIRMGPDNVYRRLRVPAVRAALREVHAIAADRMLDALTNHALDSAKKLAAIRDHSLTTVDMQVQCCNDLFAMFKDTRNHSSTLSDMAARLEKIEAEFAEEDK